jgi:hypothetical protein
LLEKNGNWPKAQKIKLSGRDLVGHMHFFLLARGRV